MVTLWLTVSSAWAISPPIAPVQACPASIATLTLPDGIAEERLQSKHLIVVLKGARRIFRTARGKLLNTKNGPACWPIGLGFTPEGHKRAEGDGKTPEGLYATSDKPWSQYYAAIAVHYPSAEDARAGERDARVSPGVSQRIQRALAANKKPPQRTPLGGEILIHGGGSASDWTLGCVAMDNAHIDALRATLPNDMVTEVLILP